MSKYKIIDIDYDNDCFYLENINLEYIDLELFDGKLYWSLIENSVLGDNFSMRLINELYKKGSAELKIIAEYCISKCIISNQLFNKLEIITNNNKLYNPLLLNI